MSTAMMEHVGLLRALLPKGELLNDIDFEGFLDTQHFGVCAELRHLGCPGCIEFGQVRRCWFHVLML